MFFTRPKPPKPMPPPDPADIYLKRKAPSFEVTKKRREMIEGLRLMEAQGYRVKLPLGSGKPRMVKMPTPRALAFVYY